MRTPTAFLLPRLLVTLAAVSAVGCSGTSLTYTCSPPCGAGSQCTANGCVADGTGATPDLAVSGDLATTCPSSCSGATPFCNAGGACVACLEDTHCPAGSYCRVAGPSTVCAPGCNDDSRCSGGMKCCSNQCIDTAKDARNCGACGTSCMVPNAGAACVNGQCTAGTCRAGWGDCNQSPADGCETNLRTDVKNCAACGGTCSLPHGIASCSNACYLAACDYGYEDCNANEKDGCEVATLADTKNCGACGMVCAQVSRAQVGCNIGACALVGCNGGFSDCNGVYNDGCEVATGTDIRNCGKCGSQCAQGQVCINGECTCPVCNFPNAKAGCFGNMCGIASCNAGWANCDGATNNGCEQNVDSNASNCGACGVKCANGLVCVQQSCTCPQCKIPNAKSICINNVCVLDSCLPGFANCDGQVGNGCEVDLALDSKNCGACGKACAMGTICCQSACIMGGGGGGGGIHGTQTFNFTGNAQTFTIPQCVFSITLEAWGAQGGDSDCCNPTPPQMDGGLGGYAKGDLAVKPGDVLTIYVGGKGVKAGAGGFNGGGKAGQYGGGGGGASDVRLGAATLNDRVIVGGAGGGGNCGCPDHGSGGAGGGLTGDSGVPGPGWVAGGGGTQNAGGSPGSQSTAGQIGVGGGIGNYHDAGGGGGWYGGGGAYASGGGGGSSYIGNLGGSLTTSNQQTGDGVVKLTW